MPNSVGTGALLPAGPPENGTLASTNCSMATAMANVAMARLMPRHVCRGQPDENTHRGGDQCRQDRGDGERHAAVGQADHGESGDAGERELGE